MNPWLIFALGVGVGVLVDVLATRTAMKAMYRRDPSLLPHLRRTIDQDPK